MTKIVVFAGAGASKAVNAERFPTTIQFFERLPDEITSNSLFRMVVDFLRKSDEKKQVDIEEVLWELQEIRNFSQIYRKQSAIIPFGLQTKRLIQMAYPGQNQNLGALDSVLASAGNSSSELIGRINAIVYDFYSYEPAENELQQNWTYLLDKLEKSKCEYTLFTTNYDICIETAISIREGASLDQFTGQVGRISKRLDLDRWKNYNRKIPLLTKLHGSINWKFGNDAIQVGDSVYTGDHKKQAIIYPGFKGTSDSAFFAPMHSFLGDRFEEADVIIFIGFAFRDDYINDMIAERVRPVASIFSINPVKRNLFPIRRLKSEAVHSGFNRSSIDECFDRLPTKLNVKVI